MFYLRRTPAKKGYRWESCRETRRPKNSNRPASIWPEDWPKLGDKVKAQAIVNWNKEFQNRAECRKKHSITEVVTNKDEIKDFNTVLAALLLKYEDKAPPVIPCYTKQEKMKMAQALSATMVACIRDSKNESMRSTMQHVVLIQKNSKP